MNNSYGQLRAISRKNSEKFNRKVRMSRNLRLTKLSKNPERKMRKFSLKNRKVLKLIQRFAGVEKLMKWDCPKWSWDSRWLRKYSQKSIITFWRRSAIKLIIEPFCRDSFYKEWSKCWKNKWKWSAWPEMLNLSRMQLFGLKINSIKCVKWRQS